MSAIQLRRSERYHRAELVDTRAHWWSKVTLGHDLSVRTCLPTHGQSTCSAFTVHNLQQTLSIWHKLLRQRYFRYVTHKCAQYAISINGSLMQNKQRYIFCCVGTVVKHSSYVPQPGIRGPSLQHDWVLAHPVNVSASPTRNSISGIRKD